MNYNKNAINYKKQMNFIRYINKNMMKWEIKCKKWIYGKDKKLKCKN
jgi:hypothetical protein